MRPFRSSRTSPLAIPVATFALAGFAGLGALCLRHSLAQNAAVSPAERAAALPPNSTGKVLMPEGDQTGVGSFPNHLVLSPDGRFVLSTSSGSRSFLSVLDADTGKLVSQVGFNGPGKGKNRVGLYYGLAFGPKGADGATPVYAARGSDGVISLLTLSPDGQITYDGTDIRPAEDDKLGAGLTFIAGIAVSPDGRTLLAANNTMDKTRLDSAVYLLDTKTGAAKASVPISGYPFAVQTLSAGPNAGRKAYVGSEQQPVVSVIDPQAGKVLRTISVGSHPIAFALNRSQTTLYIANANSDTVSVVDTGSDKVVRTILLRPSEMGGLTGATPTGVALSPDDKTLYVTLGDLNAVALVDARAGTVSGYIPVGWYPTGVAVSPDGRRLFVANAKGIQPRVPNDAPVPVAASYRPTYIQSVLEGTVSTIDWPAALPHLADLTRTTLAANHFFAGLPKAAQAALSNPGIQHIFYIIKENRTYDQVLGDLPEGNGDPTGKLVMFGRSVTPNLHALAERFVLLDNFYCCSEVSGDGWNWSTGGMGNEYVERNVPYGYTGRARTYDYEGTNNTVAVDLQHVPDVSTPESGYIWDQVAKAKIPFRNYSFFTDSAANPRTTAEAGSAGDMTRADKRVLLPATDENFRHFDLNYADSDGWVKLGITPFAKQRTKYGKFDAPSRISEWRREFDEYVKKGNLPRFNMLRIGNDHTQGTTAGVPTPAALVADNDYAIGELVEAVSHSPYWKSSAIFVIEDDAQSGQDHVDCHRSTAYVISPFVRKATHDSRFYNTDSFLHTMECLMGLPPLNQYVATSPALAVFASAPENDAPFDAILPDKTILSARNAAAAYRSGDSPRYFPASEADAGPDDEMNDILWHSIKGIAAAQPAPRYSLPSVVRASLAPKAGKRDPDGDGD